MPEMKKQRSAQDLGEKPGEEEGEEKRAGVLEGACAGELSCNSLCGPRCPCGGRGVRNPHRYGSLPA
jgi:hypothetical protein